MKKILLLSIVLFACAAITNSTTAAETKTPDLKNMTGKLVYFSDLVRKGNVASDALSDLLNYDKVIIDFYADWCGPCTNLNPILTDLAREFKDVLFVKLNIDQFQSITQHYGIRGIPALLFFKNGTKVAQIVGQKSKNELKTKIKNIY